MIVSDLKHTLCLDQNQYAVYQTLSYFRIFSYPLLQAEIEEYCGANLNSKEIESALQDLRKAGVLFETHAYYSLDNKVQQQLEKRKDSEARFNKQLKKIRKYANLISRFPFVRFVGITGSCAKGLFEKEGDVDYFIVTEPGKLWLCRTILILFKKIILLNSHRYFCLNYFVDSDSLSIPDHNIYAAHEIMAMAPVNNTSLFNSFRKKNLWTHDFFPGWQKVNAAFSMKEQRSPLFIRLFERLFRNALGDALDNLCFRVTVDTWHRRFPHLESADFNLRFRSKKNVSKHHPRGFQTKVLSQLRETLVQVEVVP